MSYGRKRHCEHGKRRVWAAQLAVRGGWETGKPSPMGGSEEKKPEKRRPECVHGRMDWNG